MTGSMKRESGTPTMGHVSINTKEESVNDVAKMILVTVIFVDHTHARIMIV